jgi:micrococcal nuclease
MTKFNVIRHKKIIALIILCILVSSQIFGSETKLQAGVLYDVSQVIDGDTIDIKVGNTTERIRVLGIDTPETVDPRKPVQCYGKEASNKAKELLGDHKVKLSFSPDRELQDKYGRYLAYVFRDDGLFYNEYMLANGFAREYTYGKAHQHTQEFKNLESQAKSHNKGLWDPATCNDTKDSKKLRL